MATANIRLYVEHPLGQGQTVPLGRDQAHYLFAVLRLGVGDALRLFNGRDGEWRSTVVEAAKRGGLLRADERTGEQQMPPDLWLLFCDEALAGRSSALTGGLAKGAWAILIGPEGGFSEGERRRVQALPFSHAISLGPRILRPDTAAVAAMTVWQQALGDWG